MPTFVTPAGVSISVIFLPVPGGFFNPDNGGGGGGVPFGPEGGGGGGGGLFSPGSQQSSRKACHIQTFLNLLTGWSKATQSEVSKTVPGATKQGRAFASMLHKGLQALVFKVGSTSHVHIVC